MNQFKEFSKGKLIDLGYSRSICMNQCRVFFVLNFSVFAISISTMLTQ